MLSLAGWIPILPDLTQTHLNLTFPPRLTVPCCPADNLCEGHHARVSPTRCVHAAAISCIMPNARIARGERRAPCGWALVIGALVAHCGGGEGVTAPLPGRQGRVTAPPPLETLLWRREAALVDVRAAPVTFEASSAAARSRTAWGHWLTGRVKC